MYGWKSGVEPPAQGAIFSYDPLMARIVVFQHGQNQTPARLGMTLRDHGYKLDIRRVDLPREQGGSPVPEDLDGVAGVLIMGGKQNVDEPHPWMKPEIEYVKAAHDANLPVIGICLGCQVIAKALGAEVGPMDKPEAGFQKVSIIGPGHTDRILGGVAWDSYQFQSHQQEVKGVPPGATLLATSKDCKVQAFKAGLRTYAFQYHFELDRKGIDTFFQEQGALFADANIDAQELSQQADKHYASFARLADRVSVNIATLAFSYNELLKA